MLACTVMACGEKTIRSSLPPLCHILTPKYKLANGRYGLTTWSSSTFLASTGQLLIHWDGYVYLSIHVTGAALLVPRYYSSWFIEPRRPSYLQIAWLALGSRHKFGSSIFKLFSAKLLMRNADNGTWKVGHKLQS